MKVQTNLSEVVDYINEMNNNIQSIISNAIEMAKIEITEDLFTVFGIPTEDLSIDFYFDGIEYKLTVDGINQYQLFNNTGYDLDFIVNYIENKMLDKIQLELDDAGYGHGN